MSCGCTLTPVENANLTSPTGFATSLPTNIFLVMAFISGDVPGVLSVSSVPSVLSVALVSPVPTSWLAIELIKLLRANLPSKNCPMSSSICSKAGLLSPRSKKILQLRLSRKAIWQPVNSLNPTATSVGCSGSVQAKLRRASPSSIKPCSSSKVLYLLSTAQMRPSGVDKFSGSANLASMLGRPKPFLTTSASILIVPIVGLNLSSSGALGIFCMVATSAII